MTTVAEFIAYLQTLEQDISVQVLVGKRGRVYHADEYIFQDLVISDHCDIKDLRGNRWVPEKSPNYNKVFLELGEHPYL